MAYPIVPNLDRDAFTAAPGHERWDTWIDDAGIERSYKLKWLYNGTGAAVVAQEPMVLRHDGDADIPMAAAVCTESPPGVTELICVPIANHATATWGWYAVQGYVEIYVNGDTTDVTKDTFLKMDVTVDDDAAISDSTTRSPNSFAIYSDDTSETDATPSTRLVRMFGWPVPITAS